MPFRRLTRRTLLRSSLASAALTPFAPSLLRADGTRPSVEWGAAIGDVTGDRALLWSRTDRPARLVAHWSTSGSLANARRVEGPVATPATDFTAPLDLSGLPPGQDVTYRLVFEDLADRSLVSAPVDGRFRTAPAARRDVLFGWSADTVGQGWGIDEARGGMKVYESMRAQGLDFFVHCGDTIYADDPLVPERTLDDGTIWKNVITPAKSKVAETLEEFRGCHRYNLLDANLRRFLAEVPQVVLWDDHEVKNNWWPGQVLTDERYTVRDASLLATRSKQAFLEYQPVRPSREDPRRIYRSIPYGPSLEVFALDLRSERGPNTVGKEPKQAALLGARQLSWLKSALTRSKATWKVVAIDQPVGLLVPDGPRFDSYANGDPGAPLGRELEMADLLSHLKKRRVGNVVFVTGDVHYAAAHRYDPERAAWKGFDPFWEFVAGPLHAGTFGPNALDDTFGPEVKFCAVPTGLKPNRPPSEGLQFFGTVRIDGNSQVMTVRLHDREGKVLYAVDLAPAG